MASSHSLASFTSWKKYSKDKPVPMIFFFSSAREHIFHALQVFPFLFPTVHHLGICGCEQLKLNI